MLEVGAGPDSKPQRGQNVTINLKTTLTDGTAVGEESSFAFTLGDGDVIQVCAFGVETFWVFDLRHVMSSKSAMYVYIF